MIVPLQSAGSIEDFNGINRKSVQHILSDACPKKIIRMRRDSASPCLVNQIANFQRRSPLQIWQHSSATEKVTFRGCDFNPWNDNKIVNRQAVIFHLAGVYNGSDRVLGYWL